MYNFIYYIKNYLKLPNLKSQTEGDYLLQIL